MSATHCRRCNSSTNTRYCCGRETDFDESFERELILVPGEISLDEREAEREANRTMVHPLNDFEKSDILRESIESLGWDAFRLEKSGELERAKNLRTVIAMKESEMKTLNIGIRRRLS